MRPARAERTQLERLAARSPLTIPDGFAEPYHKNRRVDQERKRVGRQRYRDVCGEQRDDQRPNERGRADGGPAEAELQRPADLQPVPRRSRLALYETLVECGRPKEVSEGCAALLRLRAFKVRSDGDPIAER